MNLPDKEQTRPASTATSGKTGTLIQALFWLGIASIPVLLFLDLQQTPLYIGLLLNLVTAAAWLVFSVNRIRKQWSVKKSLWPAFLLGWTLILALLNARCWDLYDQILEQGIVLLIAYAVFSISCAFVIAHLLLNKPISALSKRKEAWVWATMIALCGISSFISLSDTLDPFINFTLGVSKEDLVEIVLFPYILAISFYLCCISLTHRAVGAPATPWLQKAGTLFTYLLPAILVCFTYSDYLDEGMVLGPVLIYAAGVLALSAVSLLIHITIGKKLLATNASST